MKFKFFLLATHADAKTELDEIGNRLTVLLSTIGLLHDVFQCTLEVDTLDICQRGERFVRTGAEKLAGGGILVENFAGLVRQKDAFVDIRNDGFQQWQDVFHLVHAVSPGPCQWPILFLIWSI
ncbi:MAG TPA: hypothetical protein PLG99_06470 [Kaistiaceae bacterium]|nr:hypothetical protein [Kaistiaceae bacterium]